jgi:uncharacterized protein involved in exopolysaccharide biosynthesis
MLQQSPNPAIGRDLSEDDESGGLSVEAIRELVGFALRAARRRLALSVLTFLVVAALSVAAAKIMPRSYRAEVKLLAQRSTPIRLLSQSTPGVDTVDNPTKNTVALVMRRDNLVALATDANLPERFRETRPAALRFKDRVMGQIFGAPSDQDMLMAMAYTLEKQLEVEADDMTVTITVDWANPRIAYDLATLVQKNFMEARYDSDVSVINASLGVLEDHAKEELARVDSELEEYNKQIIEKSKRTQAGSARGLLGRLPTSLMPRTVGGAELPWTPDPDLAASLEEKRLRIRAIEESQQRTVDTLRQEIQKQELSLTPMHPVVIALQQHLEAASQPSPELLQLRGDVRALMAQLVPPPRAMDLRSGTPAAAGSSSGTAGMGPAPESAPAGPNDPLSLVKDEVVGPLALSESRLSLAMRAYQDALTRLDAAKVELDITRTISQHRYTVLSPAEVPRKPRKATASVVAAGGVMGGAIFAILLAATIDWVAGRILESWQIRRRLKLDVLAELDKPS